MQSYLDRLYTLRKSTLQYDGDELKLLLARLEGSTQQTDIEIPLINRFFRIKEDVKKFKDPNFDWKNEESVMKAILERFDMPTWALYRLRGRKELSPELKDFNDVFVYQTKTCNLRCPYCYVDDDLKDGRKNKNAEFFSISQILEAFYEERERREKVRREREVDENGRLILPLNRIRPSGGEPSLVPEQWKNLLEKLEADGLSKEVYVQSDTNLTTGHFIEFLERKKEIEKGLLQQIGSFKNFGLLASIKGTDSKNYARNTGVPIKLAEKLVEETLYTLGKYVDSGVDAYPFLYNPNPETLEEFLDRLKENLGKNILKKTWVYPLNLYNVTKERLRKIARRRRDNEEEYVRRYEKEWKENFLRAEEIMRKINPEYKKVLRVGL